MEGRDSKGVWTLVYQYPAADRLFEERKKPTAPTRKPSLAEDQYHILAPILWARTFDRGALLRTLDGVRLYIYKYVTSSTLDKREQQKSPWRMDRRILWDDHGMCRALGCGCSTAGAGDKSRDTTSPEPPVPPCRGDPWSVPMCCGLRRCVNVTSKIRRSAGRDESDMENKK